MGKYPWSYSTLHVVMAQRGQLREERVPGTLAMLLRNPSDQMWDWFREKIAGNSAVGVVVSHTRHRLASSVQGNREGQLFPFIHFELLKDHVKWERMLLLYFIRKNIK